MGIDSTGNIFVGTRGGMAYRSTDGGESWEKLRGGGHSTFNHMSIAPNGYIYATTLSEGILRSTDKGETWEAINEGIDWRICSALGVSGKGDIFVSTAESTYGTHKEKIYYSKDNGDTWEDYTSNTNLIQFQKIIFDKEDNVYLATDESVWKSNPELDCHGGRERRNKKLQV